MLVYTGFERKPLLFSHPREIISCFSVDHLKQAFDRMESCLDKGYYLAGFLSYEAGYGFEKNLSSARPYSFPLVYMGCFESPEPAAGFCRAPGDAFSVTNFRPSLSFPDYREDIRRIRAFIAAGDVYQITYCLKTKFDFEGSARSLFCRLLREQRVPYPAYIETDRHTILSLSPEMFVKKNGRTADTKPMKGTWPRGNNPVSDLIAGYRLKYDAKNRAENVMIVDLLRNDLGRIGEEVRVKRLFEVTPYATLYQMTSSISATVREKISLYALFEALFPSGSVTGAPKVRAMEIIRGLEREERKVYTGAIGYVTPERDLFFNVPIRTILLEDGGGEMGVGGGIIWDSTPEGEWAEGELKARFLSRHAYPSGKGGQTGPSSSEPSPRV